MRAAEQVPRFLVVGVVSTLVHISMYSLAIEMGLMPVTANVLGYLAALLFSFLGHYHVSFKVAGSYLDYLGKFILTSLAGLAASTLIMYSSTSVGVDPYGALAIVVLAVPALSYFMSRFWVFSRKGRIPGIYIGMLATTLTIVCLALGILDGTHLNHDSSWYLTATERWLNGSNLYSDILEINPPLSFYLTIPAIVLARDIGLDEALTFRLLVVFGATVSALVSTAILKRALSLSHTRTLFFTVSCSAGLLLSPIPDFGQREHLMLIFSLPLMTLLLAGQDREHWVRCVNIPLTLIGMLGIALKPHFLIPIMMVLAVDLFFVRSWRTVFSTVHLTMLAALLSYLAMIAWVHPDYLGFMMPLGIAVYGYSEVDIRTLITEVFPIMASALLMLAGTSHAMFNRKIMLRGFAILLGFAIAYVIQSKGWSYQLVPVRGFAVVLVGLTLAVGIEIRRGVGLLSVLMLVTTIWYGLIVPLQAGPYRNHITIVLKNALEDIEGAKNMMFFSTNVSSGFPLVQEAGLVWTSRFPTLWLVPGIVDQGDPIVCVPDQQSNCGKRVPASVFLRESVTDDLIGFDTDLVIIDVRKTKSYVKHPFDYLEFMKEDVKFQAFWQSFKLMKKAGSYEIWQRVDI